MTVHAEGVAQPPLVFAEEVTAPPAPPYFGPLKAIAALLVTFLAQFFGAIALLVAGVAGALVAGFNVSDSKLVSMLPKALQGPLLLVSSVATAAGVLAATGFWAWPLLFDRGPNGLGVKRIPLRDAQRSVVAGLLLGIVYLIVAVWLFPYKSAAPVGPLAAAAASGGLARVTWALVAVVYAPALEEFLFRGLLFRGLANRWGVTASAIVVTILFVAMHFSETAHYWPANIVLTLLAIAAILARIRTGSLVAPLLIHLTYNSALVAAVYLSAGV